MFGNIGRQADDSDVRAAIVGGSNEVQIGRNRGRRILDLVIYFVAGLLFCLLVWWIVAELFNTFMMKYIEFPTPLKSFERLWELFFDGYKILTLSIFDHIGYSLRRWAIGFLLAALIGILIGAAMGADDRIYRFGMVPVNILQMIPGLAWFPVCMLLFGLGEECAVFIIAVTAVSPVAINVCNGLRRVPKVNMMVARMSGKSRSDIFFDVMLPFATMDFITGFRVGMANAWRMLIAAEMVVGVAVGLGYSIQIETAYLDYGTAFACIMIICAIGLAIDKLVFAGIESYAARRLGLGGEQ